MRSRLDDSIEVGILSPRDADEIFALVNSSRNSLRRFLPWVDSTKSPDDEADFLRRALELYSSGLEYHFGIWFNGLMAGGASLSLDPLNNSGEIGYFLGDPFTRRGIITKVVAEMTSFAFGQLGINRLEIFVADNNERSIAVAKRCGFSLESRAVRAILLNGLYLDRLCFSMLASDYVSK
ncbi:MULTISPECIES: GNAT family protein [Acidithrix]|uniref:GNAT family N-acetyltransferase n=1 Tax=Acidithrix TaxID=1609233 RepID=UPI0013649A7E|nr:MULTISPECIES: GNAT family protein [Acidithrix]